MREPNDCNEKTTVLHSMKTSEFRLATSFLVIGFIILLFEVVRSTFFKSGDFSGYLEVGNLVLQGSDIYQNPKINTWPPFFSIVCVPLALAGNISAYLIRFLWLAGSVSALYFIMNLLTKSTLHRRLMLFPLHKNNLLSDQTISILHWIVLIPFLIILRYIMDNLANIQINIFMLLLAMLSVYYYSKNKDILSAFILAFSISMKVYTIFLFLFFVIKRDFKVVGYCLLFLFIFSALPFLVFGYDTTIHHYETWYNNNVLPFASVGHKNQSYFSMMRSLFMHESPGLNQPLNQEIYINIANLSLNGVKIVSYGMVFILGIIAAYVLGEKNVHRTSARMFVGFVFVLTIIPLLSPLAWKGYFVFLWPSFYIQYLYVFRSQHTLNRGVLLILRILFLLSIVLTVFSSELFVGRYISNILETFSVITIGSILSAISIFVIYCNHSRFKLIVTKG